MQSEIHLLDCLARKEQDEITVADLKQYSVVKITLMTRYLDDLFQGYESAILQFSGSQHVHLTT